MEITKAPTFWLALTCILAASSVPLGSAEQTQRVIECFSSLTSVEGCIEAIDKAVSDKMFGDLAPACCKAIIELSDNCWTLVFPDQPFVPFMLKAVCKLIGHAEKLAPAPYY